MTSAPVYASFLGDGSVDPAVEGASTLAIHVGPCVPQGTVIHVVSFSLPHKIPRDSQKGQPPAAFREDPARRARRDLGGGGPSLGDPCLAL